MERGDAVELRAGGARAVVASRGAELRSWRPDGTREVLWSGDPAFWDRRAPLLFPVVGACAGGALQIGGRRHPMPQHGFARDRDFRIVEATVRRVHLRLTDSDETRPAFPFPFCLDVTVTLGPTTLAVDLRVANPGPGDLPYAIGVHPGFAWPFDGAGQTDHVVRFEAAEIASVPYLTRDGLLRREHRAVPLDGRTLPLTPALFERGALVFRHAASRSLRFVSPSGAAITLTAHDLPHLALWTRPGAPFLALEAWTGHADWEDFEGDIMDRPSLRRLPPGGGARQGMRLRWSPVGEGRGDG